MSGFNAQNLTCPKPKHKQFQNVAVKTYKCIHVPFHLFGARGNLRVTWSAFVLVLVPILIATIITMKAKLCGFWSCHKNRSQMKTIDMGRTRHNPMWIYVPNLVLNLKFLFRIKVTPSLTTLANCVTKKEK